MALRASGSNDDHYITASLLVHKTPTRTYYSFRGRISFARRGGAVMAVILKGYTVRHTGVVET